MTFEFPDSLRILSAKIDGSDYGFGPVTVFWQLTPNFSDSLPAVHLTQLPGQENFLEREDRLRISVYAEGTDARDCLIAIFNSLVGSFHEAPGQPGLVDSVAGEQTPATVPYASDRINQADAVVRAVVRAL